MRVQEETVTFKVLKEIELPIEKEECFIIDGMHPSNEQ